MFFSRTHVSFLRFIIFIQTNVIIFMLVEEHRVFLGRGYSHISRRRTALGCCAVLVLERVIRNNIIIFASEDFRIVHLSYILEYKMCIHNIVFVFVRVAFILRSDTRKRFSNKFSLRRVYRRDDEEIFAHDTP